MTHNDIARAAAEKIVSRQEDCVWTSTWIAESEAIILAAIEQAVVEEREACIKHVHQHCTNSGNIDLLSARDLIIAAIRERKGTT